VTMRNATLILVLLCASAAAAADGEAPRTSTPKPLPITPPSRDDIVGALARGRGFLLAYQNPDGSWGSARRTKALNIYAPVPGAHQAFRAAVTSLCLSALIETAADDPAAVRAVERGEAWLLANLPDVRRAVPRAIYNTWTHAYGIRALVRMHGRVPGDKARREKVLGLIAQQVDLLKRYECISGGWGYYDFGHRMQRPVGMATSFTTATALIALHEAKQLGVHVPKQMVGLALDEMHRQQRPDFAYCYSAGFLFYPGRLICRPGGSLGRSQSCNLALRLWGDQRITDEVLKTWLDRLYARNGWLSRARKFPVPHESWFAVAGYFFYYGHFYAGACIEQLPAAERPHFQQHLARILLDLQEKDGSWWDYPMYDYHQGWGTAYAMMALGRCLPAEGKP